MTLLSEAAIEGMLRDARPAITSLVLAARTGGVNFTSTMVVVHHAEDGPFTYPASGTRSSGMTVVALIERWATFYTQFKLPWPHEFAARLQVERLAEPAPAGYLSCLVTRRHERGLCFAVRHVPMPEFG